MTPGSEHASWGFTEGTPIADGRSVVKCLGGGNRYEVYLVWDARLFSLVVAKILRPDQAQEDHARAGLRREAEVLERLGHPVIVRGFDAVLDGPCPHLLIEHVEGPSLRSLIGRAGPLGLEQLLPLALHVAAALHYLASEGMVHLDVKPDNIIMSAPPRLIDLSLVHAIDDARRLTAHVGTDAYMAPEQCGRPGAGSQIGPATDVFGLAATLHHALNGEVPFPREEGARYSPDPLTRWPQLAEPPLPLSRSVPRELPELLGEALQRDPAQRPSAAEFAVALEPLVGVIATRRMQFRRRPRRFARPSH